MQPIRVITLLLCLATAAVAAEPTTAPATDAAAPAAPPPATPRKQSPSAKQWVNWLPPTLPPHEVEWLQDDSVFSLYFPQQLAEARGAVLLVPAAGQHAAWPDHIRALSEQLPAHGWHVLAVTPAADAPQPAAATAPADTAAPPDATTPDPAEADAIARAAGAPTVTRGLTPQTGGEEPTGAEPTPAAAPASLAALRAGLALLESKGQNNVVLIGMGAGGMTALALAHESMGANAAIRGLVLADLPPTAQPQQQLADILRLHPIAVLDISHPQGRDALQRRAHQLRQFDGYYTVLLPEPLATIQQGNDRLARRVRGWLTRYVPGQQKSAASN